MAINLYELAKARVQANPELKELESIILYDWPEGDIHWNWVLTEDASTIVEWAREIQDTEE